MVSDGIKAARIQAQHSPLINSTWPGRAFQASVLSAVRNATGWLNPHRGARRPAGRHAGPPRPLFGHRCAPCPSPSFLDKLILEEFPQVAVCAGRVRAG